MRIARRAVLFFKRIFTMEISSELPAGNIRVLDIRERTVLLEQEQRDSKNEWFYWKFKARFDEPGVWHFKFAQPYKIGTRGPAVSFDRGDNWEWRPDSSLSDAEFTFDCREPGEVWFCQGLPYLQRDWDRFTAEFAQNPAMRLSSLCKSRKGRNVELLELREGTPPLAAVLTARHHCQEMSASMVLEGALRHALADGEEARAFRRKVALHVVPFTDKDGVEEGDQGKGRLPRDHARDYDGSPIYPETAAVWKLIGKVKPFLVLDFHSPWIRGKHHEMPHLVANRNARFSPELDRFARLLEEAAPECAPFSAADTLRWGTAWNTAANYDSRSVSGTGLNLTTACGAFPFVRLAVSLEIPFANFREKTMTERAFLQFGDALGEAIARYADMQA